MKKPDIQNGILKQNLFSCKNKDMFLLILGILFIAFCVFACLPFGLAWGANIIAFLKGAAPVLAAFAGILAVQMGINDLRDKHDARLEQKNDEEK